MVNRQTGCDTWEADWKKLKEDSSSSLPLTGMSQFDFLLFSSKSKIANKRNVHLITSIITMPIALPNSHYNSPTFPESLRTLEYSELNYMTNNINLSGEALGYESIGGSLGIWISEAWRPMWYQHFELWLCVLSWPEHRRQRRFRRMKVCVFFIFSIL